MTRTASYVACRTYGHAWDEIDADKQSRIGWYLWLRCQRCGTIRMDTVDRHGHLSERSYRYPDGYKSAVKLSRDEYRLALRRQQRKLKAVS